MPLTSAGLLFFSTGGAGLEVLLVHPGGPFWARRDLGAWSIPKGEIDEGEDPLAAARREVREEIGILATETDEAIPLGSVRQKGGKIVHAWAVRVDSTFDPALLRSNTFELEWPRNSGKLRTFPEVDRAAWFDVTEARRRILPAQAAFLDALVNVVPRLLTP